MEKKLPLGVNEASVNKMFAKIQNQTGLAPSQIIKGVERGSLKISLNKEQRSSKYLENDGIIRFKVTSDNTSAKEWLRRLNSFSLDRDLKDTIREQLIPSNGINYEIVILRKSLLRVNCPDRLAISCKSFSNFFCISSSSSVRNCNARLCFGPCPTTKIIRDIRPPPTAS